MRHYPETKDMIAAPPPEPAPQQQPAQGPQPLLLKAKEAAALVSVGESTWWRWRAAGRIPLPVKPTPGVCRWKRAEILAWVEAGCPRLAVWEAIRADCMKQAKAS